MIDQLGAILEYIASLVRSLSGFDVGVQLRLIGALVVTVTAAATIAAIRRDAQFEKLKWSGVPRSAALTLQTSLLVLALLAGGLGLIGVFKSDVPQWASSVLPGVVALIALGMLLREVFFRPTFTPRRFWDYAIYPMLAPLIGLLILALPQLDSFVRALMS